MLDGRQQNDIQPIDIGARKHFRKKRLVLLACVLLVTSLWIINRSFWGQEKAVNFNDYKTVVHDTTENTLGKMTLNEVMVDDNQLLLNATYEPVNGIAFDEQIFFFPQVQVNGRDYTVRNRGQSVKKQESNYTVYSSIQVSELPKEEMLTLAISYNQWNIDTPIEQPWNFKVKASQKKVQEDKKVFTINQTFPLKNGHEVTINKVVTTPISTTVYYDAAEKTSELAFKITSASGKSWRWQSGFTIDDAKKPVAVNRFDALYLTQDTFYLIPIAVADDQALGPAIRIRQTEEKK